MKTFRKSSLLLTFKGFLTSAFIIAIFTLIMLVGVDSRHDTITEDVIGQAERIACSVETTINSEKETVEYTALCPWGKETGVINTFTYFTSPPENMLCYKAQYANEMFTGCDTPEHKKQS